jgi:hypothetical protein
MCIKFVIKTNLYYDARSEKHRKTETIIEHEKVKDCCVRDKYLDT